MTLQIAFRLDSSPTIGSGHVMRCLTLAGKLRELGVECVFICREHAGNLGKHITEMGFRLVFLPVNAQMPPEDWLGESTRADAAQTVQSLEGKPPDWMITDHYAIGAEWQKYLCKHLPAARIMAIDDLANRNHACDLLLDLSPGREAADYARLVPPGAEILTGLDYALLRPEFAEMRARLKTPALELADTPLVLVALGGGDTGAALKECATALSRINDDHPLSVRVIGASPQDTTGFPPDTGFVTVSSEMAAEIARSDFMISGAGGTSWERCCLGTPSVVLTIAENQEFNANAIGEAGTGLVVSTRSTDIENAVRHLLGDPAGFANMAQKCWDWCDGQGTRRVADAILSLSMTFDDCMPEDARFVYEARYGDGAERYYKNPVQPEYEDHIAWFKRALNRSDMRLYRVGLAGHPIAHVRLDLDANNPGRCELGIAVASGSRGKGYSVPVLKAALSRCRSLGFAAVDAEVHPGNAASRKLFERCGFALKGDPTGEMLHYERKLD